jgi:hypothetical protein
VHGDEWGPYDTGTVLEANLERYLALALRIFERMELGTAPQADPLAPRTVPVFRLELQSAPKSVLPLELLLQKQRLPGKYFR